MKTYEYDVSIAVTLTVRAESVGEAARIMRRAPFLVVADPDIAGVTVSDAASLESYDLMEVREA